MSGHDAITAPAPRRYRCSVLEFVIVDRPDDEPKPTDGSNDEQLITGHRRCSVRASASRLCTDPQLPNVSVGISLPR
ncbi:hypothetical protein C496_02005 [Natronorubrum tibetense GA33]|uniref:Uncharacterized protein n=1 Tax=Natronorubrum tibetense GA33 TaxID=1114856 RepID=L9W9J2_9EURY|nr:hypothetical protein C496_02005 [Natronorubrum tibetense GA33]